MRIGDQVEDILNLAYKLLSSNFHKIDMRFDCCCTLKNSNYFFGPQYETAVINSIKDDTHHHQLNKSNPMGFKEIIMNSINAFRQQFRQGLQHVNHTSNQAFRALCCRSIDTINHSNQQNTNRLHGIQASQTSIKSSQIALPILPTHNRDL